MSSETPTLVIISYSRPNNLTYSAFDIVRTDKVIGLLAVSTLYMEFHLRPRTLAEPYGSNGETELYVHAFILSTAQTEYCSPTLEVYMYIKTVGEI